MKKFGYVIMTIVIGVNLLTGCGKKDAPKAVDTTKAQSQLPSNAQGNANTSNIPTTDANGKQTTEADAQALADMEKNDPIIQDMTTKYINELYNANSSTIDKALDTIASMGNEGYKEIFPQFKKIILDQIGAGTKVDNIDLVTTKFEPITNNKTGKFEFGAVSISNVEYTDLKDNSKGTDKVTLFFVVDNNGKWFLADNLIEDQSQK